MSHSMVVMFTDFGVTGPYIGQMQAALFKHATDIHVINLFADAPGFNPVAASYLLPAYVDDFPKDAVFLCVIDPGVGSEASKPIVAEIDGRQFVGPDNGLFDVLAFRAKQAVKRVIKWQPSELSASFHGRDLFAPVAAKLAAATLPSAWLAEAALYKPHGCLAELDQVIYIDSFGNVLSGRRAESLTLEHKVIANGQILSSARTFSDVAHGEAFWYQNSNGLLEIAVNCGHAAIQLSLSVGDELLIVAP